MPEQMPSPDVVGKNNEGVRERSERVLYTDFDAALNELKFDQAEFEDAMFKAIVDSSSNAFTLLKWHMGGPAAVDGDKKITRDDFDTYMTQSFSDDGGFRKIFDQGMKSLGDDFKFQQKRFSGYTEVLKGGKAAKEIVKVAGKNGAMLSKTRAEALRDSGMAARIENLAKQIGKPSTDVTFEDAFDNQFYNSYLQPSMLGVAEYGLTWLEYRSKSDRNRFNEVMTSYRKGASDDVAGSLLADSTEKPVDVKPVPKVDAELKLNVDKDRSELDSIASNRYDFLKFALRDRPGVTVKFDKSSPNKLPAIGIYKNNKIVIALEFGKNKDEIVAIARNPDLKVADVEHVSRQNEGIDSLIWFVNYKLDHPGLDHQNLMASFGRILRLHKIAPAFQKMFEARMRPYTEKGGSSMFGTEYENNRVVYHFAASGAPFLNLRIGVNDNDEVTYEWAKGDRNFQSLPDQGVMLMKLDSALAEGFSVKPEVKEKVIGVTKAEAIRRGDIVFDKDSNSWKPKAGMEYKDKNKKSENFDVQLKAEYRKTLAESQPELISAIEEKMLEYKASVDRGDLKLSQPIYDSYGHPYVYLNYKGADLMYIETRVLLDSEKPSYRLFVAGKAVDLTDLDDVVERVENILKKKLRMERK